jgi:hypothetical protein
MSNDTLYYDSDGAGTFTQVTGSFTEPESNYKIDYTKTGGSLFMTTGTGIRKLDALGGTVVNAGVPKGLSFDLRVVDDVNWFSDGATDTVAYRHVWEYEDSNGITTTGAPSERQQVTNTAGADRAVELRIYIPSGITTSYVLKVYRSSQVSGTPPEDFQLVYQANPTSAEIAAEVLEFNDILADAWRGANLYTNTTQEGISNSNERPPLANVITTFKNYTFYGNIENRQRLNTALISVANLVAGTSTVTFNNGTDSITIGFVAPNAGNTITGAADNGSGLIRITSAGHGLTTGEWVRIYDVVGTTEANGTFEITVINADTFDLIGSAFANAYTSGGTADLYEDIGTTPRAILHTSGTDAQNIDSTAKSIVRCLNLVTGNTYWDAFYSSTANDPVGKMEFTAQSLGAAAFYLIANNAAAGGCFSPTMPTSGTTYVSTNDDFQNGLMWSKQDQPEAVPLINIKKVGSADDPIVGIVGLRDSLFIIKESDGIYRLTGETTNSWNFDEFDGTVENVQKNSITKGENAIFMFSSHGYVKISDVGVEVISRDFEKDVLKPINNTNFSTSGYGWYYEDEKAYKVTTYEDQDSTSNDIVNEYNVFTNSWTQRKYGVYTNDPNIAIGAVVNKFEFTAPLTGGTVYIERKDNATTDYTLPDISNTIIDYDTSANTVTLGTAITIHDDAILKQGAVTRYITAVGTTAVYDVSSAIGLNTNKTATVSSCADNGSGLIRVTTAAAHGLSTNNGVTIASVVGTTEANGDWVITVIDTTNFDLIGSTFTNAYTSGGTVVNTITILPGVYSRIKYQQIHAGYPEYEKTFDKLTVYFDDDETDISKLYINTTTDADKTSLETEVDEQTESVWQGTWQGQFGSRRVTDKLLTLIPEEHFRGSYIYLDLIHSVPQERADITGFSLLYDVVDSRYQK